MKRLGAHFYTYLQITLRASRPNLFRLNILQVNPSYAFVHIIHVQETTVHTVFPEARAETQPLWDDEQGHGSNSTSRDAISPRPFLLEVPKVASVRWRRFARVFENMDIARAAKAGSQRTAMFV